MSYSLIREILEEPWNPEGPSAPTGANAAANGRRVAHLRPTLRGTELIVALCIAVHADNETRQAWPGIERLARMTRRSRRAVYRAISGLRRKGILEIIKGGASRFGSPGDLYVFRDPIMELFASSGKSDSSGKSASTGKSATSGKSASSGTESVPPVALKLPVGTTMEDKGTGDDLSRCRAIFRMRPHSRLDHAQSRAWRNAEPLVAETKPEEWEQLEAYYGATLSEREDFRRRDLATLLNNWSGELTRAAEWCRKVGWMPPRTPPPTPDHWRELVALVLERDYPDQTETSFVSWDSVPDWLRGDALKASAAEADTPAPAEWQEAVALLQAEGEIPAGDFTQWSDVPLPVRIQLRTALLK